MTTGSYPERMIVHSNVKDGQIVFHKLPVNVAKEEKILRNQNILKYVQIIFLTESQLNVI